MDGGASGADVHRLVRPIQAAQVEDAAGVDRVGIACQGLDGRHRQLTRTGAQRRTRFGTGRRIERLRFVQRAGPGKHFGPRGQLQPRAARQGLQSPEPAGRHGGRALAALGVQQNDFRRAGGLGEIMGGQTHASLGRRQAQRLAHGA